MRRKAPKEFSPSSAIRIRHENIDQIENEIEIQTATRLLTASALTDCDVRLGQLKADLSRAKAANSQNCLLAARLEQMAQALRTGAGNVSQISQRDSPYRQPTSTFEIRTEWETVVLTTPRAI